MANEKDTILSTDEVDPEIDAIDVSGVNAPAGLPPEAEEVSQDQDYEAQFKDPETEGHTSPMSPLFDAYKSVNEGYARFLESPAYTAAKVLSNIKFDPNQMALLHNYQSGHEGESIGAGVLQGFLSAVGMGGEGETTGPSKSSVDVQKAYESEGEAEGKAQQAEVKAQQDVVNRAIKDPGIVVADAQLKSYDMFKEQWNNLLNSGAVLTNAAGQPINRDNKPIFKYNEKGEPISYINGDPMPTSGGYVKGSVAVFTPEQAKSLLITVGQLIRPGMRVSTENGEITDDTMSALGAIPTIGPILKSLGNAVSSGTSLPVEGDDLRGIKTVAESVATSALNTHNKRINYLMQNDHPTNKQYYDGLLYSIPNAEDEALNPVNMEEERMNNAILSDITSTASMKQDAAERLRKKQIKAVGVPSISGGTVTEDKTKITDEEYKKGYQHGKDGVTVYDKDGKRVR